MLHDHTRNVLLHALRYNAIIIARFAIRICTSVLAHAIYQTSSADSQFVQFLQNITCKFFLFRCDSWSVSSSWQKYWSSTRRTAVRVIDMLAYQQICTITFSHIHSFHQSKWLILLFGKVNFYILRTAKCLHGVIRNLPVDFFLSVNLSIVNCTSSAFSSSMARIQNNYIFFCLSSSFCRLGRHAWQNPWQSHCHSKQQATYLLHNYSSLNLSSGKNYSRNHV